MPPSRRNGRSRFTLILLVLASLTVLTLSYRGSAPVNGLRRVAGTVFDPVRSAGAAVGRPFSNAWDGASGHDKLKKENEKLQRQIDQLKGNQVQSEVALREVTALKHELELKQASDIPTVAAQIVSGPLTNFDSTLQINRGSGDGVRSGMAVETEAGLIGRVVRVTGGRSTIELLSDPDFQVGIQLARQGDYAVAHGGGTGGTLVVSDGIPQTSGVKRGDPVITSGLSGSPFPAGVTVGTVASVSPSADRTSDSLVVRPAADLHALTYVTVMLCDDNCS